MYLGDAITKYGAINALNPISISSKDDLVNPKDSTLTELAKKSFSYTVSNLKSYTYFNTFINSFVLSF